MDTPITHKHQKFLGIAIKEALKSNVLQRHGSVLVSGGKIIGRGYNLERCVSKDGFLFNTYTCHAEISAIRAMARAFRLRSHYRYWV